jgi:Predicted integral membrane protein (DUF2275)/Putative zinc-finger
MNCQEVQKYLSEFLDESLDVERSQTVSDHLAACSLCSEEMASLAECQRLVSSLPAVEPPTGFATRVMAHVRDAARKPSLWDRLFSPLRIKIPLQATAVVLIAVLAAYIYQKEPLQRELVTTIQPEKFPGREDETDKLAPTFAQAPTGGSKTTQVPHVAKVPVQEFKDSAQLPEPRAKPGEQNKGISGRRPTPTTPSENQVRSPATLVPAPLQEKSSATSGAASTGLEQSSPSGEAHAKRAPQPVPKSEKESASRDTAFTGKSSEPVERTAAPSLKPFSSGTVIGAALPADQELVIRLKEPVRDDKNTGDRLASGGAQSERRSLTLPEEAKNFERAREQAVQTGQSQTVWVTTARNQYQLFKKDLAELGNIEVESSTPELKSDAIAKSSDRLRIKVTILPPPSSRNPVVSEPSDR